MSVRDEVKRDLRLANEAMDRALAIRNVPVQRPSSRQP
jgi:hypothetical protein